MIQLDTDYIFASVGGPKALIGLFDKHLPNHGLKYPTVQMWRQRDRVSTPWIPGLLFVLYRAGADLSPCFLDDQDPQL